MSGKTRVLSFLLVLLLSIPFVFAPSRQGDVLGAVEDRSGQGGQIAGGVVDNTEDEEKKITGKAIWSEDNNAKLKTDKFNLSTGLTITHKDVSLNLVVEEKLADLDEEVLLVLDKKTFQELGGNLDQESIEVTVVKN
jgi:hypothetical protein